MRAQNGLVIVEQLLPVIAMRYDVAFVSCKVGKEMACCVLSCGDVA